LWTLILQVREQSKFYEELKAEVCANPAIIKNVAEVIELDV
jgi:hypothetical protein